MLDLKEHQHTIAIFDLCYKPAVDGMSGAPKIEQVALPTAGGMTEQPAKLMQALKLLESVALDELREDLDLARKKKDDGGSGTHNKD